MSDLISREALREAFSENCLHNCYYCKLSKWYKKGNCYICGLIDNAPTVEGFTKEDMSGAYNEGYACGSRENERTQGEWIPVSERLPEKEGFYLVFLENEQMVVAHSSGIIANHDYEPKMLAWRPLPEPYRKGGAE